MLVKSANICIFRKQLVKTSQTKPGNQTRPTRPNQAKQATMSSQPCSTPCQVVMASGWDQTNPDDQTNHTNHTNHTKPDEFAWIGQSDQFDQSDQNLPDQVGQVAGKTAWPGQTSMHDFAAQQTARQAHVWALAVVLMTRDLMRTFGQPERASLACIEQGLFAVGAACETKDQFPDVMSYIVADDVLGRYVGQMGRNCVYNSLLRGFASCEY
jgi:hypothetical protein